MFDLHARQVRLTENVSATTMVEQVPGMYINNVSTN